MCSVHVLHRSLWVVLPNLTFVHGISTRVPAKWIKGRPIEGWVGRERLDSTLSALGISEYFFVSWTTFFVECVPDKRKTEITR